MTEANTSDSHTIDALGELAQAKRRALLAAADNLKEKLGALKQIREEIEERSE